MIIDPDPILRWTIAINVNSHLQDQHSHRLHEYGPTEPSLISRSRPIHDGTWIPADDFVELCASPLDSYNQR